MLPKRAIGGGFRAGLRAHLAVLALFQILVVAYTYPLIRDPGGLLPEHHDPRVFGWVMGSNVQRALESPTSLYHGNIFYPHGSTITYSEPLLVPDLVYGPVYLVSDNPVLAYNVTLLVFWALSGWALFFFAYKITHSAPAAVIAGLAFLLCPYRVEYYLEFQMHLAFGFPLAFWGWYRFLVTQRWRPLWLASGALFLTALSSIYYFVILSLALAVFTLVYVALRWRGWRLSTVAKALAAGAALLISLAPFLWPYQRTRAELGFERVLEQQPERHSADVLTYLETRSTLLYRSPFQTDAETALFMGFVVLALAALSLVLVRERAVRRADPGGDDGPSAGDGETLPAGRRLRRLRRASTVGAMLGLAASFLSIAAAAAGVDPAAGSLRWYLPLAGFASVIVFGLVGFGAQGWEEWRVPGLRRPRGTVAAAGAERDSRRQDDGQVVADDTSQRQLGAAEWVLALLYLALLFFVLSLGPVFRFNGEPFGEGLYGYTYVALPVLRALRVMTRFGVIVVFCVSLLAAFGATWLFDRIAQRGRRQAAAVAGALCFLILVEYWSGSLAYGAAPWPPPGPVYQRIAEEEGRFAVLEVPLYAFKRDADETLNTLFHKKYVVNGVSGFSPPFNVALAEQLAEAEDVFPSAVTMAMLRSIHPLRYIVVHNRMLRSPDQSKWAGLRDEPPAGLRFVGRLDDDDLYELASTPEVGTHLERLFSYDFLDHHPRVTVSLRSVVKPGSEPIVPDEDVVAEGEVVAPAGKSGGVAWRGGALAAGLQLAGVARSFVEIAFNERPVTTLELTGGPAQYEFVLEPPFRGSAANALSFSHFYEIGEVDPADPRYLIGDSERPVSFDLLAIADTRQRRTRAAVLINGRRISLPRPGYNVLALDPETGEVLAKPNFPTHRNPRASRSLLRFIEGLPEDAIVVASTVGDAGAQLTDEGRRALLACGAAIDLRRRPGSAHLLIGFKGAYPGGVVETVGDGILRSVVGRDPRRLQLELTAFEMLPR